MKKLTTFMSELEALNEVFVRGGKPRNGSKVLANGKNIWVWNNEREFVRLAPFINRELGTDFDEVSATGTNMDMGILLKLSPFELAFLSFKPEIRFFVNAECSHSSFSKVGLEDKEQDSSP